MATKVWELRAGEDFLPEPRVRRWSRRRKARSAYVFLILAAGSLLFLSTWQNVCLTRKGYLIALLKEEKKMLENECQMLSLELTRLKSPDRIASIARTRLGLEFPEESSLERVIVFNLEDEIRPTTMKDSLISKIFTRGRKGATVIFGREAQAQGVFDSG
jgi:cell division protein FtsL